MTPVETIKHAGPAVVKRLGLGKGVSPTGEIFEPALYWDVDISESVEGIEKTIQTHGFDTSKWNDKTFAFVESSIRELYVVAGREQEFNGISPRTFAAMSSAEQDKLPIENAIKMVLDYLYDRADLGRKLGYEDVLHEISNLKEDHPFAEYGYDAVRDELKGHNTALLRTLSEMNIDFGSAMIIGSEYFKSGCVFENVPPPDFPKAPRIEYWNAAKLSDALHDAASTDKEIAASLLRISSNVSDVGLNGPASDVLCEILNKMDLPVFLCRFE